MWVFFFYFEQYVFIHLNIENENEVEREKYIAIMQVKKNNPSFIGKKMLSSILVIFLATEPLNKTNLNRAQHEYSLAVAAPDRYFTHISQDMVRSFKMLT